jgi:hypothetical protein
VAERRESPVAPPPRSKEDVDDSGKREEVGPTPLGALLSFAFPTENDDDPRKSPILLLLVLPPMAFKRDRPVVVAPPPPLLELLLLPIEELDKRLNPPTTVLLLVLPPPPTPPMPLLSLLPNIIGHRTAKALKKWEYHSISPEQLKRICLIFLFCKREGVDDIG